MLSRRERGLKAAATLRERYTDEERRAWSRRGGQASVPKGFAKNKALARRAGEKGGKASGKAIKQENES